jgi:IclR family acetate operon transcriptional repressor
VRNGDGSLQSVTRALRTLELIGEAGELGVTELSLRLGVHKATASRLAATLAERGFVERDPVSERYRLGFGLIGLAGAAMGSLDLVRLTRPALEELANRTRETVNLGVRSGGAVMYLDQVTRHALDRDRELGRPARAVARHLEREGAAGVHG